MSLTEEKLAINSIYRATEGEGIHVGTPQIFVRFQGCAVGCVNCDSKDTWDFPLQNNMSLEEVIDRVVEQGLSGALKRVSITGGDPLHPKNSPGCFLLAKKLKEHGYWLNIEAAGTRVVKEIFDLVDFISFDVKTPSTHVRTSTKLLMRMREEYAGKFQVKSVIETYEDFAVAKATREEVLFDLSIPWVLTPSYNLNEEFPEKRFQDVIKWSEECVGYFRVIGQQHKWLYGPDRKQV